MKNNLLSKALKVFMAETFYSTIKKDKLAQNKKAGNNDSDILYSSVKVGSVELKNRIVMASMTRCRALENMPNRSMEEYYGQRSGAGLIITEGTSPSPSGLGYARMPGIFNRQQIAAWEKITSAVHLQGAKIFINLMHTGRLSHSLNMPEGTNIIAPSALKAKGQIWTDLKQMQDYQIPKEMDTEDLWQVKTDFVIAARNAILAGFDGVELNAANGYLLEQFISPNTNIRKDNYAGDIRNRCRFVIEIVEAVAGAIGKDKTAMCLSPYGITNSMSDYFGQDVSYKYLIEKLNEIGIVYLRLMDYSTIGYHAVPLDFKILVRNIFKNTIVLSGGYNLLKAEIDIKKGLGDLIAFGRPFINNPDLVERFKNNWPLSEKLKTELFYTNDEKGYTDYPKYSIIDYNSNILAKTQHDMMNVLKK